MKSKPRGYFESLHTQDNVTLTYRNDNNVVVRPIKSLSEPFINELKLVVATSNILEYLQAIGSIFSISSQVTLLTIQ